ncbi:MAG TPA: hypothetical protein VGF99_08520 [Myxococcota bacterium]
MPIVLDDSAWPILHHTVGDATREDFDHFADWYMRCVRRARSEQVRLYVLTDLRGVIPAHDVRRHASRWLASLDDDHFHVGAQAVIVVDNPLIRGAITALNWFRRPSTPQDIVEDYEHAWRVLVEAFRKNGHSAPPRPAWMPAPSAG